MNIVRQEISVQNSDGELLAATLIYNVPKFDLEQLTKIWEPYMNHVWMEAHIRKLEIDIPDHVDWDWAQKFDVADAGSAFIGIEYRDFMQGMLVLDTNGHVCKDADNQGQKGIYVSYLAAAPWNIGRFMRAIHRKPILRGIGPILMKQSILISQFLQYEGRLILHSVPRAEEFYRKSCCMKDLGPENYNSETLRRFEMTKSLAESYLSGGN